MLRRIRPASRRTISLILGIALLPSTLALTGTRPERPYSRSRWIAAHLDNHRFDGGAIPADPARLAELLKRFPLLAAKPRPPVEKSTRISHDILEPGEGSEPETQTETFLALDPANDRHLLAGYQEGRFLDGGARGLTYAVSSDGGRTWSEGILPGLTRSTGGPYERASDPWTAFGPGNRAYFAALAFDETTPANGIYLSASDDGGRSWGDPVAVTVTTSEIVDKEAVVADTRSDSPYRGRVYVAWDAVTRGTQILYASTSDDGGQTFSTPLALETEGQNVGVIPLVGPHGVVHAIWGQGFGRVFFLRAARSDDGGASWSAPVTVAESRALGLDAFRTSDGIPAAAIDPVNGTLYVVWQDSRFTPGIDQVALSRSTDGGLTWSAPVRVSDGADDAPSFTPSVAVDRNGRVGVCYQSLRNDPNRAFLVDQYCTFTRKRGGPFLASKRVNAASFDARFAAFTDRGFFLGDYAGMAGSPLGFNPLFIATIAPSTRDADRRQPDAFTRLMKP